jgi:hypothetical protein
LIVAGACGAIAVFFVFVSDFGKAFVAAAAGGVAWFLNYRAQLRESLSVDEQQEEDIDSDDEEES